MIVELKRGIALYIGVPLDAKLSDLLPPNGLIQRATIELDNKGAVRVSCTYIPKVEEKSK
jgi:hypothetical protein